MPKSNEKVSIQREKGIKNCGTWRVTHERCHEKFACFNSVAAEPIALKFSETPNLMGSNHVK